VGQEVPKNLKISCGTWSNTLVVKIDMDEQMDITVMYLIGDAKL
jgi:hypothetical protein